MERKFMWFLIGIDYGRLWGKYDDVLEYLFYLKINLKCVC